MAWWIREDADELVTENRPSLEKYAGNPAKKSQLILDGKATPTNTRLHRSIAKTGVVVDCTQPSGTDLVHWIQQSAMSLSGKKSAVQMMVEHDLEIAERQAAAR